MDKTSKLSSNFIIKICILIAKEKFSELYHRCPIGPLLMNKVNNTIDRKVILLFPTGIYRAAFSWKNQKGDILLQFSALIEIFN